MNKSIAILYSLLIIGSSMSGCFSESGDSTEGDESLQTQIDDMELKLEHNLVDLNESLQPQIDNLELKLEENLFDLDELSKSLNESNNNLVMLSEILANSSTNQDDLALLLEENMSHTVGQY